MPADSQAAQQARPNQPPSRQPHPLDVLRRAVAPPHSISRVIVGVSTGKDSLAVLDLCCKFFGPENVRPYFMFLVPDLRFQSDYLSYLERRYSLQILRIPHWGLSDLFRANTFRFYNTRSTSLRRLRARDIDAYLRKQTGIDWIATGEKACDSVERNAMIRRVSGIDTKRRRLFPLAFWQQATVYNHLKENSIALPPEYSLSTAAFDSKRRNSMSFGNLWHKSIAWIKSRYPDDYQKIVRQFPLIEVQFLRQQILERQQQQGQQNG